MKSVSSNRETGRIHLPKDIALTNIVKAKMKMISDALPSKIISFLTICCPTKAATVATATK